MRILWSIHLYPPTHNCGAEYVAHHVNKWLIEQGHEVRVMLLQGNLKPYMFEGVEVIPYPLYSPVDAYRWADVVFTHLDFSRHTVNICQIIKTPVFHFVHNDSEVYRSFIDGSKFPAYVVYNSHWIAEKLAYKQASVVLQPPCPAEYYRILGNPVNSEYITLINVNENKGGYQFYRIAQAMSDHRFLAVKGSYDDGGLMPDIVAKLQTLPNVKVIDHTPNPREIYQQTRLLLVLSRYESWGRVATEAMSNGIPVLYCPTEGLQENVGRGGVELFKRGERVVSKHTNEILEHDGDSWPGLVDAVTVIEDMLLPDNYKLYSKLALDRYSELIKQQSNQLYDLQHLIFKAKQDFENIRREHRSSSRVINISRN